MRIGIHTTGIHHLALRSTDLARSRRFYVDMLGFPLALEGPDIFMFLAGGTPVAVRAPQDAAAEDDGFSPFRAGLDHVALGCEDVRELTRVTAALSRAAVDHSGIRVDPTLGRQYVAFTDPDQIAWELYMAPNFAVAAVQAYFDGLRRKNVDQVPFAPGVVFQGPLGPELRGADAVRQFLRGVLPIIQDIRVLQHLSQGGHVGTRFELETIYGVIPAFDWFHVVNDQIVEARPFYDPRLIAAHHTP
jgi:catechol 2,3-dioxygenase-like lactoylglutathione lyase family enzyme